MTCLDVPREKQSNILLNPKKYGARGTRCAGARGARRSLRNAQDRGAWSLAAWRPPQARVGRPSRGLRSGRGRGRAAAGSAGQQGARAPRALSRPLRRALACRPAAHVFLFCVVAFVLEARIYILSVSGEWVGSLVWAEGGKKALRFIF